MRNTNGLTHTTAGVAETRAGSGGSAGPGSEKTTLVAATGTERHLPTETEPLLSLSLVTDRPGNPNNNNNNNSSNPNNNSSTNGSDRHRGGSIRARRGQHGVPDGTESTTTTTTTGTGATMERIPESPHVDHYRDDDRFYNATTATDSYTLHTDNETLTTRSQQTDGFSRISQQNSTQRQFYQQPRRHPGVYMPAGGIQRGAAGNGGGGGGGGGSTTIGDDEEDDDSDAHHRHHHPLQHHEKHGRHNGAPDQYRHHPPLLEIPEEVYAVRKAALQVLKPLTSSWLVVAVGFALTVLLGMARWTRLLPGLPFWFILLPSWCSHVGLLVCHVRSARALSRFISEANENRQRPDSTDHIDRTEYLPLLQRSLKFGLKTGVLSFCTFVFEILVYVRIARGGPSLAVCFIPLWILVTGAILDGIICKTQHFLRLTCWTLIFAAMLLAVLKVDHAIDVIRWRMIVGPIVAVLSISSAALIYVVYGHQVGFYRLTESQLTAGILYSMSVLICIVLVVVIGEVMPLSRPVEIETRVFVVLLAPLVVALTGMGAYAVSRDEFGRLLLYGGQAAVHPMKLRWEKNGWTSVPTKGVTVLPMFGEVSYRPLEKKDSADTVELCRCCSCYPYEEDDEEVVINSPDGAEWRDHPYLAPSSSMTSYLRQTGLGNYGNRS